ncbi:12,18-didecarboxysiroheme deacetylase [uncultured Desulfovibrio sp.]|uniref:12,18-didecarboxysiroheme deacetylase n=2 Tax=uncultured Desulfovibrio sp. TaxID=167968 RepID=UPI0025FC7EF3|nr:12,18-didecarboxysiroheme deacetylase [uncultured Desulfovibrio sp.]
MIGISKLYCGQVEPSDALRYGRHSGQLPSHLLQFSKDKKPVVVWNMTRRCNLKCVHCYAQAVDVDGADAISTEKAREMIDDLAAYGAPVMLFSGGEPLVRKDLVELASHATSKGMRAVISTNGTLISKEKARELKSVGLSYVGISLDGLEAVHDHFRGVPGSFKKALEGIANCQAEGLKVGLRFTINKRNVAEIPGIFRLLEDLEVPRACFYHLVYSGRGSELIKEDLDHAETRQVLDLIMDETRALFDKGKPKEILTVDNHADGPYVWMRLKREDPKRAEEVFELLQYNEGNNSGRGIGCISWDGQVHADQFWRNHTFGNVLERPFSAIWDDSSIELLHKLKDKKQYVKGRCAQCRFLNICGGNFRARAEAYYGDEWAQDPACYLTDEEIGL